MCPLSWHRRRSRSRTKPAPFARQSFTADDINPHLLTKDEYDALKARMAVAINGTGPQGGLFNRTAVGKDSVSMPGNQGGSNWGTTAADPERGLVFVTGVNQVALLVLTDVQVADRGSWRSRRQSGVVFRADDRPACLPAVLRGLPRRRSAGRDCWSAVPGRCDRSQDGEALRTIVTEGRSNMRAIIDTTNEEIAAIYTWLEQTNPTGRAAQRSRPPFAVAPRSRRGRSSRAAVRASHRCRRDTAARSIPVSAARLAIDPGRTMWRPRSYRHATSPGTT